MWEMLAKQLEADVISCGAAIIACERGKLWEKVLPLLLEMLEKQPEAGLSS